MITKLFYVLLAIYAISLVGIGAYVVHHKVKGIPICEDDPFDNDEHQVKSD